VDVDEQEQRQPGDDRGRAEQELPGDPRKRRVRVAWCCRAQDLLRLVSRRSRVRRDRRAWRAIARTRDFSEASATRFSLAAEPVAEPEARARAALADAIAGVGEAAALEREAAAADALGEAEPEALELGDAIVDPRRPSAREARPVAARRRAVGGELAQLATDLLEREADPLGEDDEGDPPQRRARVAAMAGARALGGDQAPLLVRSAGRRRRRRCAARPRRWSITRAHGHDTTPTLDLK
jgi:hypothetical protein